MMNTDSARLQPPIDTSMPDDICRRCGGNIRPVSGNFKVRQCMGCGTIPVRRAPLVIDDNDGPDLTEVVTWLAHNYGPALYRLWDLAEAVNNARQFNPDDRDAIYWQQEHDNQLRELVSLIGEIRVGGDT